MCSRHNDTTTRPAFYDAPHIAYSMAHHRNHKRSKSRSHLFVYRVNVASASVTGSCWCSCWQTRSSREDVDHSWIVEFQSTSIDAINDLVIPSFPPSLYIPTCNFPRVYHYTFYSGISNELLRYKSFAIVKFLQAIDIICICILCILFEDTIYFLTWFRICIFFDMTDIEREDATK